MNDQKKYKCPDCDKEFATAGALGPHRNKAHGYSKSDGKTDPRRKQKSKTAQAIGREKLNGSFPCPHCDFVAKWSGGLVRHTRAAHPEQLEPKKERNVTLATVTPKASEAIPAVSRNGHHHPEAEDDRAHRLEAIATLACGRVQQIIEGLAFTHDLPPRSLTSFVIRTLGQASKIW